MSSLSEFSNKNLEQNDGGKQVYQNYEKISSLSHDEAHTMLQAEVLRQKQNGTFDFEALQKQVRALENYLPEKDYKNLLKLLQTLR